MERSGPSRLVLSLSLVLGVVLVFGQAISFQFLTFDDPAYVTLNEHISRGLDAESLRWALFATRETLWHPLTWVSYLLDVDLFGLNPAGFHIVNVLVHAGSSVVLFLGFDRATGARLRSFLVAALFALHPLRADSVAWVSRRNDVLSTFFFLASVLAYAWYAQAPTGRRYAVVVLSFGCALLSKPMAVTFPVAALLLDVWPLARLTYGSQGSPSSAPRRVTVGRCLLEKAPLAVLAALASLLTLSKRVRGAPAPLSARLANAAVSYARQLGHLPYPRHLSILYPRVKIPTLQWAGASLLLVGLAAVAVLAARRRPYVTFGLAWFFVLLLPTTGVIAFGAQAMADRYSYVPCIGLLVAAVWLAADQCDAWGVGIATRAVLASVLVIASAAATFVEVSHYRDSATVFTHAVESTGDNPVAEEQLGNAAMGAGDAATALRHYEREAAISPETSVAYDGVGQALETLGRSQEALVAYEAALRLSPDDVGVRNNRCVSLLSLHREDEARACWKEAIAIDDAVPALHRNLAKLDEKGGRMTDAVAEYERALRLQPDNENAQNNLCNALISARRYEDAASCLSRAMALAPSSPFPFLGLARLYDETGHHDLATIAHQNAEARLNGSH